MNTTRREFLMTAAAPALIRLQDKAGSRPPILGGGDYTYEAIHDWGALPAHIRWGNTHGVVQDSQGNIHIHHTVHATSEAPDSMVVFDAGGKFIRSWWRQFRGVAHGLEVRREGSDEFLYLTVNAANPRLSPQPEVQAAIVKATLGGEIVWKIQGPPDVDAYRQPNPDGSPKRYNPTNLAIAPNGDVYVGDGYGSYFINQYNRSGEYLRTFGGRGSAPGQLAEPHGIWIDTRGTTPLVVVADRRNNRLQRFTLDGKHVDFIPGFRLPCHFDERQGLVVIPDLHGRVTLVDRQNAIVQHLGDSNAPNWNNPLRRDSASSADRRALWSIASIITSRESAGTGSAALASMRPVSRTWSSEPQLTPMRTGRSCSSATRMIVAKFSSWRLPPTLPGLMRYFARAPAMRGYSTSSWWPL
jgi:hypothetical protein